MNAAQIIQQVDESILGPTMKRHQSAQDLETPDEFIHAVERKFALFSWDLACRTENCKAPQGITYPHADSLQVDWHKLRNPFDSRLKALLWLNPPFDPITPWVQKCTAESQLGAEILLLSQASVDSNWFWSYVYPYATVYTIDRIRFVGQQHVYPKPLILSHYAPGNGFNPLRRWRWKEDA